MSNPHHMPLREKQFLATLAHELRNPLAPMRHCVSILSRTVEDGPSREAVQVMDRQLSQLSRLVEDLIDMSRLTRGTIPLYKAPLDVGDLLDFAVEGSRPAIEAGRHPLTVRRPDPPLAIEGDRARLAQAIANLLDNAARYSAPDSEILLEARCDGDDVVISVTDHGVGISPDALPAVFDLFSQVDDRALQHNNGLGVGLSLVRTVMELHGGSATATSAGPGQGSRFSLRLPRLAASQHAAREHAQRVDADARRILVVDDNRDAADTLATLLRLDGAVVDVAYDGPAALAAVDAFRPRAVVLDLGMPGMSGYEVARAIRDRQDLDSLKLIALTGWGQDADRRKTAEAGFDHHLTKPADIDMVQAVLSGLH